MHLLIIEDNEGDQLLLREAFGQVSSKTKLSFAITVEEAIKFLKKDAVDLILLDLNLPGKSGKDFLREFKADNIYRKIPIIILTSSQAEKDIAECYSLGASAYLTKASNFNELEDTVSALCHFWEGKVVFSKPV